MVIVSVQKYVQHVTVYCDRKSEDPQTTLPHKEDQALQARTCSSASTSTASCVPPSSPSSTAIVSSFTSLSVQVGLEL